MKKSKWLLVFNLLVVYIFLQFVWWSVLIATQLHQLYGTTPVYYKKLWMILGEGMVFITILVLGVYFVRRSFKKEVELNSRQKNFLLAVTHELKTPIAVSKLSLETIANRQLDAQKQKEIITKAIHETDRLNMLIENIMLGVKLDEKNLELRRQKTNISMLVIKQVELLNHTIGQSHKLELIVGNDIYAMVDAGYFPSIISNLYENAIKYTPEGSTISISVTQAGNKVHLVVADNGAGIPDAEKPKIFDRFYRVGNEETRTAKGTGLGLFITRQLVQMHNGSITCADNQPTGTVFNVYVPVE